MTRNLLFPELSKDLRESRTTGVFPYQKIKEFIDTERIRAATPIDDVQVQPASLDLRLGPVAYRVRASFLPGKYSTVEEKIRDIGMIQIDLSQGAILEKRCVYIIPLMEEINLPDDVSVKANPKSTTGRLDIFTRLITNYGEEFERITSGYRGKLYAEVVPRTFTIAVRSGMRLNQIRFIRGTPQLLRESHTLGKLHEEEPLVYSSNDMPANTEIRHGLPISIDLCSKDKGETIGFRAKSHAPLIDLSRVNYYDMEEFWEPIKVSQRIILNPDDFYILVSKEKVSIPPDLAGELVAYDPSAGEFRIHYAGFFDPGFGYGLEQSKGTHAVLEVRSHGVPFVIEDGQTVGRLVYERLMEPPEKLYGVSIGSSYQAQGLSVSKQFKRNL